MKQMMLSSPSFDIPRCVIKKHINFQFFAWGLAEESDANKSLEDRLCIDHILYGQNSSYLLLDVCFYIQDK